MQVTETLSEGLKRELKVVIGSDELNERLNTKLDDLKDKVKLPGFRPGKVPLSHLKKVYGRSIMSEVVQQAVTETTSKALADREERPAFQPEIKLPEDEGTVEQVVAGAHDLEFTMSFEVLPKIELADFKQIKIERPHADVTDEEVDKALERIRNANVVYETKDGAAEDGDKITMDFLGKIDDVPFDGGKGEDVDIILGRGGFIPGFEEGLKGVKAGDTKTITASFPENYQASHLAAKDAVFDVTIKEVGAPRVPEADDELAKTLGLESLVKLKEIVREQISKDYAQASRQKAKRALLDALDEAHRFQLPESLVENEFSSIWKDVTGQMERAKKTFEDEGTSEDKARIEYREMAERRVRLGLVLSEIGTRNEISVTDEEVRRAVMQRAQQFPGQEREVINYFTKNPDAQLELRMPIFEDKVVDFALELTDVAEKKVSPEELFAVEEEDHDHHVHGPDCDHDHDHDHKHG
jgi:trigger factor